MSNFWKLLACALACCFALACETTGPVPGPRPAPGQTGDPRPVFNLSLRVGEKIQIILADLPGGGQISSDHTIPEDGKITLHLDQTFLVLGKTRTQLEAEIRTRYVPNFYAKLTPAVKQEDRWVYVGGFVRQPNRYPYTPGLTLLKAVSVAGGFSEYGKKTEVTITRDGRTIVVDCEKALKDPNLDVAILPDDQVYIPRRYFN